MKCAPVSVALLLVSVYYAAEAGRWWFVVAGALEALALAYVRFTGCSIHTVLAWTVAGLCAGLATQIAAPDMLYFMLGNYTLAACNVAAFMFISLQSPAENQLPLISPRPPPAAESPGGPSTAPPDAPGRKCFFPLRTK